MLKKLADYAGIPIFIGCISALALLALWDRFSPSSNPSSNSRPYSAYSEYTTQTNTNFYQQENNSHTSMYRQPVSYAEAVKRAAPSVVNIYTRKELTERIHPLLNDPRYRRFFNNSNTPQQRRMQSALGSGVVVRDDGYIITNFHVVNGADEIVIALQDGRQATANLIGESREYDMAVLKIDLDNLRAITIGDPDQAQVGDVVLAIGNPFGVGQTVTQGIVSGTRRKDLNISLFENFIQTDAAINPGNSGGALVDAYGNLLGINIANLDQTQSGNASGIGFAIPADKAIQTLNDIIEFGRVIKGWLGVGARDLNPQIAQAQGLQSLNGIWITAVYKNGPADKAGLRAGDVIVGINNEAVDNISTGWKEIAGSRPGSNVDIRIMRGGESIQLNAILDADPRSYTPQN